ncbi:hypothetical protein OH76DRAFT_1407308, partial [Lentinus brumalis]
MAPFLPPAAALTVAPSSTRLFHLVSLSSRERHPPYSQSAVTTPRRPSSSNGPSNGQGRPTFLAPTRSRFDRPDYRCLPSGSFPHPPSILRPRHCPQVRTMPLRRPSASTDVVPVRRLHGQTSL